MLHYKCLPYNTRGKQVFALNVHWCVVYNNIELVDIRMTEYNSKYIKNPKLLLGLKHTGK